MLQYYVYLTGKTPSCFIYGTLCTEGLRNWEIRKKNRQGSTVAWETWAKCRRSFSRFFRISRLRYEPVKCFTRDEWCLQKGDKKEKMKNACFDFFCNLSNDKCWGTIANSINRFLPFFPFYRFCWEKRSRSDMHIYLHINSKNYFKMLKMNFKTMQREIMRFFKKVARACIANVQKLTTIRWISIR